MHPPFRPVMAAMAAGAVLGGGVAVAHAASSPTAESPPVAAPQPVVHIVRDSAGTVALPHLLQPAAAPANVAPPDYLYRGATFGAPLHLPEAKLDACNSQAVVHPDGFASMAAHGQDTVTQPDGSSFTYQAYQDHTGAQYTCTESTADGGVRVLLHLIPVSPDQSTYAFTMGPSGLVLQSIAPGYSQTPGDFLPVNLRLGAWPGTQCMHYANSDLGPRHASVDDTFCFAADGLLQHATISEKATDVNGVHRDLEVTVDLQR